MGIRCDATTTAATATPTTTTSTPTSTTATTIATTTNSITTTTTYVAACSYLIRGLNSRKHQIAVPLTMEYSGGRTLWPDISESD